MMNSNNSQSMNPFVSFQENKDSQANTPDVIVFQKITDEVASEMLNQISETLNNIQNSKDLNPLEVEICTMGLRSLMAFGDENDYQIHINFEGKDQSAIEILNWLRDQYNEIAPKYTDGKTIASFVFSLNRKENSGFWASLAYQFTLTIDREEVARSLFSNGLTEENVQDYSKAFFELAQAESGLFRIFGTNMDHPIGHYFHRESNELAREMQEVLKTKINAYTPFWRRDYSNELIFNWVYSVEATEVKEDNRPVFRPAQAKPLETVVRSDQNVSVLAQRKGEKIKTKA